MRVYIHARGVRTLRGIITETNPRQVLNSPPDTNIDTIPRRAAYHSVSLSQILFRIIFQCNQAISKVSFIRSISLRNDLPSRIIRMIFYKTNLFYKIIPLTKKKKKTVTFAHIISRNRRQFPNSNLQLIKRSKRSNPNDSPKRVISSESNYHS